ncbi:unnamed protein product [Spirodela intermedia]|uniref:Uncharacterized protein n=1 Tax=Spirodela intermedia TaxID=51605 RepID=A0A7I8KEV3_SPIIN|nr:unnamed protein product [Spirodela intermedia]
MDLWEKLVHPVKRAFVAGTPRGRGGRKTGTGMEKLHDDVQSCGYEDVQVMWEMLRTEMEVSAGAGKRRRPFVRLDRLGGPAGQPPHYWPGEALTPPSLAEDETGGAFSCNRDPSK